MNENQICVYLMHNIYESKINKNMQKTSTKLIWLQEKIIWEKYQPWGFSSTLEHKNVLSYKSDRQIMALKSMDTERCLICPSMHFVRDCDSFTEYFKNKTFHDMNCYEVLTLRCDNKTSIIIYAWSLKMDFIKQNLMVTQLSMWDFQLAQLISNSNSEFWSCLV